MRWTLLPQPDEGEIKEFAKSLNNIPIPIAKVLWQRGINTFGKAEDYFNPRLEDLHDPFLMRDMNKAVDRILRAITAKENILIYGDYDVDGTTSVALMSSYLKNIYPNTATYIPDRYEEGYGISYQGIDFAHDNDISLIIALDCGIKAINKVDYAVDKDIDFIICDHHTPGANIPEAVAVLDPKRPDCPYPYKGLSGCGVGFKLCQALQISLERPETELWPLLDLAAIAIGADIVPLTGENRILAFHGFKRLNQQPRPGLKVLAGLSKIDELTISRVVFTIAPRINAAGRMEHGSHAVAILTAETESDALEIAKKIETLNQTRRETDKNTTQEALNQIEENNDQDRYTTVVYSEYWHKGVIGIVASRLIEHYYRPTIVFTGKGDILSASARSISGYNVYEAIEQCRDHIIQFGGHKAAAGLTLKKKDYPAFKEKFEEVVRKSIDPKLFTRTLHIDTSVKLAEIDARFNAILKRMAPFGPGNMRPVFLAKDVCDTGKGRKIGSDKTHLKLTLADQHDDHQGLDSIGFGMADLLDNCSGGNTVDVVFTVEENTWQGRTSIQLNLKGLRS